MIDYTVYSNTEMYEYNDGRMDNIVSRGRAKTLAAAKRKLVRLNMQEKTTRPYRNQLSCWVKRDIFEKLKKLAKELSMSQTQVVEKAIDELANREK